MKTLLLALLLICFSVLTVDAQHKSKPAQQQAVKVVIDVLPDGTKQTREIYATGAENMTVTKVKPPKNNDVTHEEQTYDFKTKTFVTTHKLLANGKVVENAMPASKAK